MSTIPYISWLGHGAANLAPPGVFTDAKAAIFVIEADTAAIQKLVDTLLNPAGGGIVRYEAIGPVAMLSFMDIARCTSGTDIAGWLPGREAAVWIPLVELHSGNPLADRLVMWSPYIFINYTIGMVIGREDWGWPKVLADIAVASDGQSAPAYSVKTTFFPTLAAATQGVTGQLYSVTGGSALHSPQSSWRNGIEAVEALTGALLGGVADVLIKALNLSPQAPSVALKQFREPGAPQTACYQAITDSPIAVTAFHGGGLLDGQWELEVTTCESHPVVRDLLGRTPDPGSTKLPVKFAAWVVIDFEALAGHTIVAAAHTS